MNEQRHIASCFHLGDSEDPKDSGKLIVYAMPMLTRERIRKYLKKELLKKVVNCPVCGGLLPEIKLYCEGVEYSFTCTKIRRNRKTLAKTDYAKFAKYCHDNEVEKGNKS